jgi:hypothetical protein
VQYTSDSESQNLKEAAASLQAWSLCNHTGSITFIFSVVGATFGHFCPQNTFGTPSAFKANGRKLVAQRMELTRVTKYKGD